MYALSSTRTCSSAGTQTASTPPLLYVHCGYASSQYSEAATQPFHTDYNFQDFPIQRNNRSENGKGEEENTTTVCVPRFP